MKKLFIALLLFSTTAHAQEVITGLKEETDLPVLNEELRKVHVTTDDLDDRITVLEATGTTIATQAQMETGTNVTAAVTPGRTQYHPGVAKAWVMFDGTTAGTNAPTAAYNVATVTRNTTGDYRLNYTTPMSSANYAVMVTAKQTGAGVATTGHVKTGSTLVATSCTIVTQDGGSAADAPIVFAAIYGDQ
jgi:hypothetical protein